ncbi:MAG: hypothetical protein PHI31_09710 [Desulfuromonadaceae bacterium]|nr:hypothetical protein [Desulfuromonadaceae bacterium]
MSEHDFQQLTLLANIMAIADKLMSVVPAKSYRYNQYKGLREKAASIEQSGWEEHTRQVLQGESK